MQLSQKQVAEEEEPPSTQPKSLYMGLLSCSLGVATLSPISTCSQRRWRERQRATGAESAAAAEKGEMDSEPRIVKLKAIEATPESFREFGQVIEASPDGEEFGPQDAHLELNQGVPRFYIMHLEDRALKFSTITHHASVTQCLGSIGGDDWYLGVAKASIMDKDEVKDKVKMEDVQQSKCGHHYLPPIPDEVRVFRISGPKFVKLNKGTWHAGPLFRKKDMDFYNLELSNTNVVDHTTHSFSKSNGIEFLVED